MTEQNKRQLQYNAARQALLSAGLELFVRKGYVGTKIRDITDAADVSPGLLFHYFSSKEAILEELMTVIGHEFDAIAGLLQSDSTPREIFETIAARVLESFSDVQSRHMFMLANQVLTLDTMPPTAKALRERSQSIELSVPLIMAGQQSGDFRNGEPLSLAILFWGALQGIAEILVWKPGMVTPDVSVVMGLLIKN